MERLDRTLASAPQGSSQPSLAEEIRAGGPLAKLFHEVVAVERDAAERGLSGKSPATGAIGLLGEARRRLEARTADSPLAILRACSAGCSACCQSVCVDITPLEALAIAEHLRKTRDAAGLALIRGRLAQNLSQREKVPAGQQQALRLPCGLLSEDGLCESYDARPLVCAGVYSLSSVACQQAAQMDAASGPTALVPLDRPAKVAAMGTSGGLQRALVDAGLDGNLYELNSIVLKALDTPDALRRWLRREDVFRDCICTDRHSPPRVPRKHLRIDEAEPSRPKTVGKLKPAKRKKQRR